MLTHPRSLPKSLSNLSPVEISFAKSHLLNILRTNPWLSRFYADFFDLPSSNCNEINNLQARSGIFFNPDLNDSPSMSLNRNIALHRERGARAAVNTLLVAPSQQHCLNACRL